MPTYAFYADEPYKRRPDGINTVIANGVDVFEARAAAERIIGAFGALSAYAAVDLATAPAFVVQGHPPVGANSQSVWPTITRGGDTLKGR